MTQPTPSLPRPSVLFLGRGFAGHSPRFRALQEHVTADGRLTPTFAEVTGWQPGGLLERLPIIPPAFAGRLRASLQAKSYAALPRPDLIWTSATDVTPFFAWSQLGPGRRPVIIELDWTLDQKELWASDYFGRGPRRGLRMRLARALDRLARLGAVHFAPWSNWAAESLVAQGIPRSQITVLPPGVDLAAWRPRTVPDTSFERPLRVLFVGGDFERKGGDILARLVPTFAGAVELDMVTRASVTTGPGVRVHRFEPGAPGLRDLYASADLFVMPSKAECFGLATIEAMATGLPVIVSDRGGARDIVEEDVSGWLVEPDPDSVRDALTRALHERPRLRSMGAAGRKRAEALFDGERNDRRVVDLVLAQIRMHRRPTTLVRS